MDQGKGKIVDVRAALGRVMSVPAITLQDADRLARDYGLEITGPDGDGFVWADIVDPRTRARHGENLGDAHAARDWLAWRRRRR